jgi:hypothetical protein
MKKTTAMRSEEIEIDDRYLLFDSLLEGCQVIDQDWRYVYLNPVALGHARKPENELIGFTMMEAYPGIDTTPFWEKLEAVKEDG